METYIHFAVPGELPVCASLPRYDNNARLHGRTQDRDEVTCPYCKEVLEHG